MFLFYVMFEFEKLSKTYVRIRKLNVSLVSSLKSNISRMYDKISNIQLLLLFCQFKHFVTLTAMLIFLIFFKPRQFVRSVLAKQ